MKRFNLFLLAAMVMGAAALTQCSTTEKNVGVNPPLDGVNVAFNNFTIDPTTGGEISIESGTKITVPANAFTDEDGNPVTKPVQIKYREFHTATDIIASGIPMEYKSENGVENFESAGMFEIEGYADGKPVFIKDDKNVKVDMGSYKDGEGYAMYYFDENTNEWKEIAEANVRENTAKKEKLANLPAKPAKPIEPRQADKGSPVINLQVNYDRYPELEAFNGVMWQYAGSDAANNPFLKHKELQGSKWTNVNLTNTNPESGAYTLSLTAYGKEYTTQVVPVFSGKNLERAKAVFKEKQEKFEKTKTLVAMERQRCNDEANLLRTFQVNNFGIYNCDRFYNSPVAVTLDAEFDFDKDVLTNNLTLYMLPQGENAVVRYTGERSWSNIRLDPTKTNTFVAVMPGNKIAYCKTTELTKVPLEQFQGGAKDYTFKMRTIDKRVDNMDNLSSVLAGLN